MLKADFYKNLRLEVEEFISHFHDCRNSFLNGNCYWFARVLQERFKPWYSADIMYNQIDNHFACRIDTLLFDANGIVNANLKNWVLWAGYLLNEPLDAARVYRDCIWQMPEEEWDKLPNTYKNAPWTFFY